MNNLPKKINGRMLSDEMKVDPDTKEAYRATRWNIRGHDVQINHDRYGYHVKGGGQSAINLDEGGVISTLMKIAGLK